MKVYKLSVSEGFKDYIGLEVLIKEDIQTKIKNTFLSYNYEFIETPSLEYIDVFNNDNSMQNPDLYNLINRQGEIMALRNDMTKAIARVMSNKANNSLINRLCYLSTIFRYPERYQGKLHEFTQAGVELIGCSNILADIEIITLAINSLLNIGIKDFSLHLSTTEFFEACFIEFNLDNDIKNKIYECINNHDAVMLRKILKEANISKDTYSLIIELIESIGNIKLLDKLSQNLKSKRVINSLNYLKNIYYALETEGLSQYILFDFSILSYGQYYTGINFQVYTKGIGSAIIEGGRYDKLIKSNTLYIPAVGFAVYINELIKKQIILNNIPIKKDLYLIGYDNLSLKEAYLLANNLRSYNNIVELSIIEKYDDFIKYSKKINPTKILYIKNNKVSEVII